MRWLAAHRPPSGPRVTVHGDYRMGNLLVGPDGLRGVLDWELAHTGDPAEDIGWLCAPAWRFGGSGDVGGFGALPDLLAAYADAGGDAMTPERVHWWQVYATVKWATICALQASAHLSGATRSVELAAIGRRVCESEWDLFALLGTPPPSTAGTDPGGRTDAALRPPDRGRARRSGAGVPRWSAGAQRGRRPLRGPRGAQRLGDRRTRAPARSGLRRRPRGPPGRPRLRRRRRARPRRCGRARSTTTGNRLRRRWPRRRGTSCWWRTRPTCPPPAGRARAGAGAGAARSVGAGRAARPRGRRRPPR